MKNLIKRISGFLKIIGDPIRFEMLKRMKNSEKSASEFEKEMNISQSYTSQQLKTLLNANLLEVRKNEDNIKMYSVKNPNIFRVFNNIQSFVIELEKQRLDDIMKAEKFDTLKF